MANYVIGDIQGCYDQLMQLLSVIDFKPYYDRLWLVGDLVNRGPASLEVLRYLASLPVAPIITLGNHDLHLLAVYHQVASLNRHDTFEDVLAANDANALCDWLKLQRLLYYDATFNCIMSHAGVAPQWSLEAAQGCAHEVEQVLQSSNANQLLANMYGNVPNIWDDDLRGIARWRLIINYLTRMRFCDRAGKLELHYKGTIANAPAHLQPWFAFAGPCWQDHRIVFGHWAGLAGHTTHANVIALDTGCIWGGKLTALRLEDGKKFTVTGWQHSPQ